tara:strand:+ start:167 stop:331 length:165 start_codon:yes stop_codon:yes gene_type:complete
LASIGLNQFEIFSFFSSIGLNQFEIFLNKSSLLIILPVIIRYYLNKTERRKNEA